MFGEMARCTRIQSMIPRVGTTPRLNQPLAMLAGHFRASKPRSLLFLLRGAIKEFASIFKVVRPTRERNLRVQDPSVVRSID